LHRGILDKTGKFVERPKVLPRRWNRVKIGSKILHYAQGGLTQGESSGFGTVSQPYRFFFDQIKHNSSNGFCTSRAEIQSNNNFITWNLNEPGCEKYCVSIWNFKMQNTPLFVVTPPRFETEKNLIVKVGCSQSGLYFYVLYLEVMGSVDSINHEERYPDVGFSTGVALKLFSAQTDKNGTLKVVEIPLMVNTKLREILNNSKTV